MKTTLNSELVTYIETPRRSSSPSRIDGILEARMRAFLRARRIRRFTFFK